MRLALLLVCTASLLLGNFSQATALMYRGCAYRAVEGKEQALKVCLGGGDLCVLFYCSHNHVFSARDCGCVPKAQQRQRSSLLHHLRENSSNNSDDKSGGDASPVSSGAGSSGRVSGGGGGMNSATTTTTVATGTPVSSSEPTPTMILSAGGSIPDPPSTVPPPAPKPECQPEVQIEAVSPKALTTTHTPTTTTKSTTERRRRKRRRATVKVRGVRDLGNGWASYDGYSSLTLPAYAGTLFRSGLTVDFTFQEGKSPLRQVLMTNCKHGAGPSVEIVLDVELGVILFHVMYRFRHALNAVESSLQVAVPYTAYAKKRVVLVFDGVYLRARVNDHERSARVQGHGDYVLAQRAKPIVFGNTLCDVDDIYGFRGQIGQISLYRCAQSMQDLFS